MWKSILLAGALIGAGQPAGATSLGEIEHPLPIHIGGRAVWDEYTNSYAFQWPGVYFETRYNGGPITIRFEDDANNYNVLIDNALVMVTHRLDTAITLAAPYGPHTVRVEKRSETQYSVGHFRGFTTPSATELLELPVRARQIEFIGDSLTVGYGNTSAFSQCTPEQIFETTDAQQGFGPVTAKHFDADYQINAFSGLGMVRNYDGREHPKYHMPMLYERTVFDDPAPVKQPANEPAWHPQVIVIGIGGNDFSTPVRPDEPWHDLAGLRADYVKTYTAFVKMIRARNPDAWIVLATPPEREEGYTGGTDDVFKAMTAAGDTKIDRVTLPELDKIGCNGHPSTRADARIADFYIHYFDAHPQVWQGK